VTQSRIAACFAKDSNRKLLVPYITAGDPDLDTTLALMHTLVKAGSDVIELGIPFSDPMADGPVIQAACERALKNDVTLVQVIETVKRFRETNQETAVVLIVDLPPEEADELVSELNACHLDSIFLLSPTTPDARVKQVCDKASGYIYYVSLKGVTGAANLDTAEVASRVAHIKSFSQIPVAVGFGIRDGQTAAAISKTADAIVVGSVLVSLVAEYGNKPDELHQKMFDTVNAMRLAMDAVGDSHE